MSSIGILGPVLVVGLQLTPMHADDGVDPSVWNDAFQVAATQETPSETENGSSTSSNTSPWEYRLVERTCSDEGGNFCMAFACGGAEEVGYLVERRLRARPESGWSPYTETCIAPDGPVVTPGMVLDEVRRIGLPSMSVEVPPETLVNYDTVVYTDAETFTRTVTLLGFTVDVEASPSQFHWTYDDGTTETTTTGGRPYPAKDITHTWEDAHHTFHPSVDVKYQIRFRVDGGGWQTLVDTITIDGPEGNVRIREATGMLADMN
jgi:hypothetical protein